MQMLIFKSSELEIINPCIYKNNQNQNKNDKSDELMVLYQKIKAISLLVGTVLNKLYESIKKSEK